MRLLRIAAPCAAALSLASSVAGAAVTCESTIASSFVKFARQHLKVMQRCRELVLLGRATGPCPDVHTSLLVEKVRAKLREHIDKHCGGADQTCGTGGDDTDLATVGWNIGQCPGLHGGQCTNAIQHCGDVADCLQCIGETAVANTTSLVYDSLTPSAPFYEVFRCQKQLGRSTARYVDATVAALATCEQRDLADLVPGACPDLLKTAPRLARAAEKLVDRICHSCGSSDQICGGDDLPPEWIGFPASCPDVTVPGGGSCAAPVHNLSDLVACVHCVSDFAVGCLDPLSVPTLKGYPGSCPAP